MNGRSAGGLVLLLIGSLGLIGYLTGNLDRWLGYLFTPPAGTSGTGATSRTSSPAVMTAPAGANYRGGAVA